MKTNHFDDLIGKLAFEKIKEDFKKSPLDMALYGAGIAAAGWATNAYGPEGAFVIVGAATVVLSAPLIGGLSARWAYNRVYGRRTPFVGNNEFRFLRRLLQTACNVFAWCAYKVGRPATAVAVILLGAVIGMTPAEVVGPARSMPVVEFTVAYQPPTWREATVDVKPFQDYGRGAEARINAPLDYRMS